MARITPDLRTAGCVCLHSPYLSWCVRFWFSSVYIVYTILTVATIDRFGISEPHAGAHTLLRIRSTCTYSEHFFHSIPQPRIATLDFLILGPPGFVPCISYMCETFLDSILRSDADPRCGFSTVLFATEKIPQRVALPAWHVLKVTSVTRSLKLNSSHLPVCRTVKTGFLGYYR